MLEIMFLKRCCCHLLSISVSVHTNMLCHGQQSQAKCHVISEINVTNNLFVNGVLVLCTDMEVFVLHSD